MGTRAIGQHLPVPLVLWLLAVVAIVSGIIAAIRGQILAGIALIILGLLVGPGLAPVVHAEPGDRSIVSHSLSGPGTS